MSPVANIAETVTIGGEECPPASLRGEALHPYPEHLLIATKGGFVRSGPEYADMGAVANRHYLRQAAYMSARRLGLSHIDPTTCTRRR